MGSQNEQKPVIRPPMQLPASHPIGRRGTPSRPIKGSNSQPRQAPEPARSSASRSARPAEGRFQPSNNQFHRRSFGQSVADVFTGMQSAIQGAQRARPRRDDYGAPSEAMARANSRPARFDDEDSRDYTSYTDASVEVPISRWDEDSAEYRAHRDPWDRQWTAWSERDGADEDDGYYDDDNYAESSEWASRRHDRTAWGGWPDAGTMASVAVNAVDTGGASNKKRAKSATTAKPTTSSVKQLLTWAGSGFAKQAMPTRKAINLLLVLCILGTVVLSTVGMAFAGYNDYNAILTGAKSGQSALTHMSEDLGLGKSGKTTNTIAAYNDLTQALNDFQMIHDRLAHPDFILGIAGSLPVVDKKLQSGLALTTIGVEAMQMMIKIFPALVSISKVIATSPISTAGDTNAVDPSQLLRATDILNLTQGFNDAKPYIDSMIATLNSTPPDTLVSALNSKQKGEILPFLQFVPQLPNVISFVNDFLPLAPTLLGTSGEVGYALTTLDNGEIRPVGGFQGQVALFSVNGGHVSHISLQDIYQIENKSFAYSNVPTGVNEPWWNGNGLGYNIRNSGLSPDFPTSARYFLNELHNQPLCKSPLITPSAGTDQYGCPNAKSYLYPDPKAYYPEGNHIPQADPKSGAITTYESQAVPMVGMLVIQQTVIKQLIQRTGPIQVGCPYNVTVTPDNLEQKIHYYQETGEGNQVGKAACAGGASDATKRFSSIVATTLLNKIKTISKTDLIGFVGDVLQDFRTRDIQVYFADPNSSTYQPYATGEDFLAKYGATSTVYTGAGDSLLVNQANIAGDKLDNYLSLKLADNITIGRDHSATHNLTINYNFAIPTITVNPADAKVDPNFGSLPAWKVDVYNTIFDAGYSPDYAEFRRVYVAPHAQYITGSGLLSCTGCPGVYNPSSVPVYPNVSDVPGRIAYGAFYDYRVESPDGSAINWFPPDQLQNPTMSWKVPNIAQNGTYSLTLQRQSGMTTSADITIQCANGTVLKHVTQAITVDTQISVPTTGC